MSCQDFEQELDARLRALAAATAGAEAPPRVEAALRAAFRRPAGGAGPSRWWWAAAAALVVAAGAALLVRGPAAEPAPLPGPAPEIASDFILLDPAWQPAESGQTVRVRLPRTALLSFGLPMNEERAFEPIQADVVLGQDGVARAIRFVR
ncbi:MAG: hypothetical protein AAB225_15665 [Acidobacteriota bacterium]